MSDDEKLELAKEALNHIRHARYAYEGGAPIEPALKAAERRLLLMLFSKEEVDAYFEAQDV